jgi:hypothetical protein
MDEPGRSPAQDRAGLPPWVPSDVGYDRLPEKVRAMVAEIVAPAYEQLVVRARDALEKTTGLTIVHLVWQEIVDQIDLARDFNNVGSVLGIVSPAREDLIERHLRLIYAKLKAGSYLMRVRDFRRGLARAVREAKPPPDARPVAEVQTERVSARHVGSRGDSPSAEKPA